MGGINTGMKYRKSGSQTRTSYFLPANVRAYLRSWRESTGSRVAAGYVIESLVHQAISSKVPKVLPALSTDAEVKP